MVSINGHIEINGLILLFKHFDCFYLIISEDRLSL